MSPVELTSPPVTVVEACGVDPHRQDDYDRWAARMAHTPERVTPDQGTITSLTVYGTGGTFRHTGYRRAGARETWFPGNTLPSGRRAGRKGR